MDTIKKSAPLILSFIVVTVALASYALGLEDIINEFDIKIMEKTFVNYNWSYAH
jgi:hypothetical protein